MYSDKLVSYNRQVRVTVSLFFLLIVLHLEHLHLPDKIDKHLTIFVDSVTLPLSFPSLRGGIEDAPFVIESPLMVRSNSILGKLRGH